MKGKNNYLFLVNEVSDEIRQHYDDSYEYNVDVDKFIESQKSKEDYLEKQNITYNMFVVPDKSILLRKFLPFDTKEPVRVLNDLSGYVHDLSIVLNEHDYYLTDSHVTKVSGLKCISYILSTMHPENSISDYYKLLWDKLHIVLEPHKGDLLYNDNWSYGVDDYYKKYLNITVIELMLNNEIENMNNYLPKEFKVFKSRPTSYFRNEHSISDKKAIVLRDSSTEKMKIPLISYYREVIFYWDYWYFNKNLIEWFKPDDVIEIRTERFLSNPVSPILKDNENVKIMLLRDIINFSVSKNTLIFEAIIKDEHLMPVNTTVLFSIDDEKIIQESKTNELGLCKSKIDISNLNKGKHTLNYKVKETENTKLTEYAMNFIIRE